MENVSQFLEHHTISQSENSLVEVTKAVANIPWGEQRTVKEVLQNNEGTCTGKHLLLQACYDALGIDYRPVVCTFAWQEQPIQFPPHVQSLLETTWLHGHNFVQIKGDDNWIDVDVTWDPALKSQGFKTFPTDWDGTTSFVGVDHIHQRWEGVNLKEKKSELLDQLSAEQRQKREEFLKAFIEWIASLRS